MMNHALVNQSNLDEMGQRRPTLVEEGVYRVQLVDWVKHWLFRRPMLVMRFRIVDEGENWGKELYAYYRVEWRGDQIKAGWKSDFCREYQACFGEVERTDRFAMTKFKDVTLLAEIKTINTDQKEKPLARVNQYSVIERLTGVTK
jgi:hypothetical protein